MGSALGFFFCGSLPPFAASSSSFASALLEIRALVGDPSSPAPPPADVPAGAGAAAGSDVAACSRGGKIHQNKD
jgi:hypothetical protein